MLLNYFMVENSGIEPLTSCVQSRRSPSWAKPPLNSKLMGLNGLEPSTSRLSGVRSNQLSYRPLLNFILIWMFWTLKTKRIINVFLILRKEVIQPHLPIRLPCYDFTPIIYPTLGGWLHKGYLTDFGCYKLSWCDGRCVQDPGTYSPRRADPRLLAIPASCRRVAAYNPNWEWL